MKMLTGAQQMVETVLSENDKVYCIDTGAVCIQVRKQDGQVSAYRQDGKLFFSEKRTDFKAADIYDLSLSVRD